MVATSSLHTLRFKQNENRVHKIQLPYCSRVKTQQFEFDSQFSSNSNTELYDMICSLFTYTESEACELFQHLLSRLWLLKQYAQQYHPTTALPIGHPPFLCVAAMVIMIVSPLVAKTDFPVYW